MTDHPTELELIEWVADRLETERAEAVQAHVAACDACRQKASAQREAWDNAGGWDVRPPARDLWPAVEARLRDDRHAAQVNRPGWPRVAIRAAAAVLLAAAVGHVAGRLVRSRGGQSPPPTAFVQSLHLDALGGKSAVGLSDALQALMPEYSKEDIR